jgi:predicted nucleotide-binding protein (sugar kinase/HSP70/actin superfamily)
MTNFTLSQLMHSRTAKKKETEQQQEQKKPNENAGIVLSSHMKIYDPNTNEVLVQKRADE